MKKRKRDYRAAPWSQFSMNTLSKMLTLAACAFMRVGLVRAQPATRSTRVAHPAKPERTAKITGRIVDENGQPLPGFALGVRAVISGKDFDRLTMPLCSSSTIRGKDGKSVIVMAYEGPPPEDVIGRSMVDGRAVARPDGTYTITGLTTGHYYLMDSGNLSPGKVTSPASVEACEGEAVQAPDIVVSDGALLRGQIVDKETGAPLPGLVLRYFDAAHPPDSEWGFSATQNGRRNLVTDANGRFEMRIAPGDATFFVAGQGQICGLPELALSPRQRAEASVPGSAFPSVWAVKSGQNFYASDIWVEVSDDGGSPHQLARSQWARTRVQPNENKTLLFRLQRLVFKNGKAPRDSPLSTVHEGDPRK